MLSKAGLRRSTLRTMRTILTMTLIQKNTLAKIKMNELNSAFIYYDSDSCKFTSNLFILYVLMLATPRGYVAVFFLLK